MAYKRLCDLCGAEIDSVYFNPRRIEYKRAFFGTYKTLDLCQWCAEEMEDYVKKRRTDELNTKRD